MTKWQIPNSDGQRLTFRKDQINLIDQVELNKGLQN